MTNHAKQFMRHTKMMKTKNVVTQEFDEVRLQFSFPYHQSSNNQKLKNKKQAKNRYLPKIDTGSDGNLMPIRMH